jgi:hypothetical protein
MCGGVVYRQPSWERRIGVIGCGLWATPRSYSTQESNAPGLTTLDIQVRGLYPDKKRYWPTPRANERQQHNSQNSYVALSKAVMTWPTPKRPSGGGQMERTTPGGGIRKLEDAVSREEGRNTGQLNPTWVAWLQGWPLGWTDLKPLEMDKYQQWCEQHGIC